jgi:hypothetical protein
MIAGEGLAGVLIALIVALRTKWGEAAWSRALGSLHFAEGDFAWIPGPAGIVLGIVLVLGIAGLLYRSGRNAPEAEAPEAG